MQLSLSMWSVHRTVREKGWSVLDFLGFCRSEGIRSVELLNMFWTDIDKELPAVAAFASEHGIEIVSYAVANDFVSESAEERAAALQEITDAFPAARTLGARIIRVFSGNLTGSIRFDSALAWIVEGLSAAAKQAEAGGLTLCLENHGKLAGRGGQVLEIIRLVGSPSLRSTFDTGNFLLVDERPTAALDVLLPYVGHVHVKDFRQQEGGRYQSLAGRSFEGVILGNGDVELPVILSRLKASGYSGALVLEYEGLGSEADGIRESYAGFRSIIQQAED